MYNSSHLGRVLAMERERQLLAAAEHHRLSREAILVPRARLVRWARAR